MPVSRVSSQRGAADLFRLTDRPLSIFDYEGDIMGPYYRATSQGTGAFFDAFYQYPILMLLFVAGALGVGYWLWRRKGSSEHSD